MLLARVLNKQFMNLLKRLAEEQLPVKGAIKLKETLVKIDAEYLAFDQKRIELVKQFCQKNEDGSVMVNEAGNASFDDEGMQNFTKELNTLVSSEIEITPISVDELGDVKISVDELALLEGVLA